MSRDELERVGERLGLLLGTKTAKGREKKLLEHDWHGVAVQVLRPMGVAVPPLSVVGKLPFVGSFRRGILLAEDYVVSMKPTTRPDWIRGRLLVAANLLEWMRGYQVPVSFKAFAQQLQNAPTAMEKAYPGWRQSGMLGSVLTSKGAD